MIDFIQSIKILQKIRKNPWLAQIAQQPTMECNEPDTLGPYKIGVKAYQTPINPHDPKSDMVTGFIWYPSSQNGKPATYNRFLPTKFGASTQVEPAKGVFPVIIHGPGLRTNGDFSYQNCEHLASHGFVVVTKDFGFERHLGVQATRRYQSALRLLDYVEELNDHGSLKGRIDLDKIGMFGYSTGFHDIISIVVGNQAKGFAPDPKKRVKAVAFSEPYIYACGLKQSDWSQLKLPVMTLAGSTYAYDGNLFGLGASEILFANAHKAKSRYFVHAIGQTHLSGGGSLSGYTDALREYYLKRQKGTYQEPLYHMDLWEDSDLRLGAKRSCPSVGLDSAYLSTDRVCENSSVSLRENINHLYEPRKQKDLDADEAGMLQRLYYTAFWKVHLQGDVRYKKYLTQEFTLTQPNAQISLSE